MRHAPFVLVKTIEFVACHRQNANVAQGGKMCQFVNAVLIRVDDEDVYMSVVNRHKSAKASRRYKARPNKVEIGDITNGAFRGHFFPVQGAQDSQLTGSLLLKSLLVLGFGLENGLCADLGLNRRRRITR